MEHRQEADGREAAEKEKPEDAHLRSMLVSQAVSPADTFAFPEQAEASREEEKEEENRRRGRRPPAALFAALGLLLVLGGMTLFVFRGNNQTETCTAGESGEYVPSASLQAAWPTPPEGQKERLPVRTVRGGGSAQRLPSWTEQGWTRVTPTPDVTPTPVPAVTGLSLAMDRGTACLTWQGRPEDGPYTVRYAMHPQEAGGGGEEKAEGNEVRLSELVPGESYLFSVEPASGQGAQAILEVPEAQLFADGDLTADGMRLTLLPIYGENGKWYRQKNPSAAAIMEERERYGRSYSFYAAVYFPRLARARTYHVQFVTVSPSGRMACQSKGEVEHPTFGNARSSYHTFAQVGEGLLEEMMEQKGTLEAGEYTVRLYFDGMIVQEARAELKP